MEIPSSGFFQVTIHDTGYDDKKIDIYYIKGKKNNIILAYQKDSPNLQGIDNLTFRIQEALSNKKDYEKWDNIDQIEFDGDKYFLILGYTPEKSISGKEYFIKAISKNGTFEIEGPQLTKKELADFVGCEEKLFG